MNETHIGALARVAAAQDPAIHDEKRMGPAFLEAGHTLPGARPEAAQSDEGLLPYVACAGSYL